MQIKTKPPTSHWTLLNSKTKKNKRKNRNSTALETLQCKSHKCNRALIQILFQYLSKFLFLSLKAHRNRRDTSRPIHISDHLWDKKGEVEKKNGRKLRILTVQCILSFLFLFSFALSAELKCSRAEQDDLDETEGMRLETHYHHVMWFWTTVPFLRSNQSPPTRGRARK